MSQRRRPRFLGSAVIVLVAGLLAGCSESLPEPMAPGERRYEAATLAEGRQLYQRYCQDCHGADAVGGPEWRRRNADGSFPPPPLNGTGHTWHHPLAQLYAVIEQGRGTMPAWGDILNDEQIAALVYWMQSHWPERVYDAWYQIDQRSRSE
jgi:mono/diheme cytochrome c family protein